MVAGQPAEPPTDPMASGAGPAASGVAQPQDGSPPGAGRGQAGPARFSGPAREHDAMPGPGVVPASAGEPSPSAGPSGPGPDPARPGPGPAGPGPGAVSPGPGPVNPGPGPVSPGPGPMALARGLSVLARGPPVPARRPPCGVRPWPGCRPQAPRDRPRAWCCLVGGRPCQAQNLYSCCAPISPGRPCCGSCSMRTPSWPALPRPGWRRCVPSSPACGHSSRAHRRPPAG